jgi:non-homologous end joining protein Ku
MARSSWDGTLIFAGFPIPLKAYNPIASAAKDSFKTTCTCHGLPIKAPKTCATTGDVLLDTQQQKAVEVSKGTFVVVDTAAIGNATKSLSIEPDPNVPFAPMDSVPLHLSEKAYVLVPGPGVEKSVAILWNALKAKNLGLVTTWVPRAGSRDSILVLHAGPTGLLANTLPDVSQIAVAPNELAMFDTAINTLYSVKRFDHPAFVSDFAARKAAAVAAAIAGTPVPTQAAAPTAPAVPDLMAALTNSLAAAGAKPKEAVTA